MLVGCGKLRNLSKSASVGHDNRLKWPVFFTEFWVKNFESFWNFQKSFWWPKKPWNRHKTIHISFPQLTRPPKNMFFCPKRGHICQIDQIGKGRETLLHGVYGSTVKNLTLTFGSKIFFLTSQHILGLPKKIWEKNPMLNFSGWPRKLGSPFNWDSQKWSKMRHIVKFRPRGTPYGKSGHLTP